MDDPFTEALSSVFVNTLIRGGDAKTRTPPPPGPLLETRGNGQPFDNLFSWLNPFLATHAFTHPDDRNGSFFFYQRLPTAKLKVPFPSPQPFSSFPLLCFFYVSFFFPVETDPPNSPSRSFQLIPARFSPPGKLLNEVVEVFSQCRHCPFDRMEPKRALPFPLFPKLTLPDYSCASWSFPFPARIAFFFGAAPLHS